MNNKTLNSQVFFFKTRLYPTLKITTHTPVPQINQIQISSHMGLAIQVLPFCNLVEEARTSICTVLPPLIGMQNFEMLYQFGGQDVILPLSAQ
jgi:hypothetical protein